MEKNHTTQESTTKIYNAVISLTKAFENVTSNYPVAGFVLRIGSGHSWDSYKYYNFNDNTAKLQPVSYGLSLVILIKMELLMMQR